MRLYVTEGGKQTGIDIEGDVSKKIRRQILQTTGECFCALVSAHGNGDHVQNLAKPTAISCDCLSRTQPSFRSSYESAPLQDPPPLFFFRGTPLLPVSVAMACALARSIVQHVPHGGLSRLLGMILVGRWKHVD